MNNYQLYRTNPVLSGHMKFNLDIKNLNSELRISNAFISSINQGVNIQKIGKKNPKGHSDNLKSYYIKYLNSDNLYNSKIEEALSDESFIIDNGNMCSTIFNMGCNRVLYNNEIHTSKKQFEFFCPVWIEKYPDDNISFKFNMYVTYGKNNDKKFNLGSKVLKFSKTENNIDNYHSFISAYIHAFMNEHCNCNSIAKFTIANLANTIQNVKSNETLLEKHAYIKLNNTNIYLNDNIKANYINRHIELSSFIDSNSTLFETDKEILSIFENARCICPQLINFNFRFNFEDVIPYEILKILTTESNPRIFISVDAYIDDKILEKKDFDKENDYIQRTILYNDKRSITKTDGLLNNHINGKTGYENVFNVFSDGIGVNTKNYSISSYDGINNSSICHYVLCDNEDYIVNTYNGFEAIELGFDDDTTYFVYYNEKYYRDTPTTNNMSSEKPCFGDCSTKWINIVKDISSWKSFINIVTIREKYEKVATNIRINDDNSFVFINNLKYVINDDIRKTLNNKYAIGMCISDKKILSHILTQYDNICLYNHAGRYMYMLQLDDLIVIIVDKEYTLTYYNFTENSKVYIDSYDNTSKYEVLLCFMKLILNAVALKSANDNAYRYDGEIKPKFASTNTLYYKHKTEYNKIRNFDYNNIPLITNDSIPIIYTHNEYSWFNDNACLLLKPEIHINETYILTENEILEKTNKSTKTIDIDAYNIIEKVANEVLSKTYNIIDTTRLQYIRNLYLLTDKKWNYVSLTKDKIEIIIDANLVLM